MKLKSFGCSFIFGSDLADEGTGLGAPYEPSSQLTWPARLALHYKYDFECHARPGSGNLRILQKILSQSALDDDALFVIGWSWIDRFDYTIDQKSHEFDMANSQQTWKTILPGGSGTDDIYYYKNLHSQYKDKLSSLIYMKTAIDILNQKNIPFIMTFIDDLIFEKDPDSVIDELQGYIHRHMTKFEEQTFLEYCKKNNFPISEKWHPLEQAHQAAADYLIRFFDKQNTSGPVLQARV